MLIPLPPGASRPRILVLGGTGQVGQELLHTLRPLGALTALGREQADLSQPASLRSIVLAQRPEIIFNAAAYTAVDRAESEPALAQAINADSPGVLAEAARDIGALLVHYSTDYVFNGLSDRPYVEDDPTDPQSVYGRSKCDGEEYIRQSGAHHLILRTSWVYAAHGNNFVRTMLRLARERETLGVVADQVGAPTSAALIAEVTAHCLARIVDDPHGSAAYSGTYHLTASGSTSWHGLAGAVVEQARATRGAEALAVREICPLTTAEYPTAAVRPANSRLCCDKLQSQFGVTLPHWQDGVAQVIHQLLR